LNYKKTLDSLYPVNRVDYGYEYHVRRLTEVAMDLFRVEGLPDGGLDSDQIERPLITFGAAQIFRVDGEYFADILRPVGERDERYRVRRIQYVLRNWHGTGETKSGLLDVGKDAVVIYNTDADARVPTGCRGLMHTIRRYARAIADAEASINITTVNCRDTADLIATTDAMRQGVEEAEDKRACGEKSIIRDNRIIPQYKIMEGRFTPTIPLMDLHASVEAWTNTFCREIGIPCAVSKRERVLGSEQEAANSIIRASTNRMLSARRKGIEECNRVFGWNAEYRGEYEMKEEKEDVGLESSVYTE